MRSNQIFLALAVLILSIASPGVVQAGDSDGDGISDKEDNCPYEYNPEQTDDDGDSYGAACDCNDTDPNINPGVGEVCDNGVDDDCDGFTDGDDPDCADKDGDGIPDVNDNCPYDQNPDQKDDDGDNYGTVCDCNDNDPNINPGVGEVCDNGVDDDCDGKIDGADLDCCADKDKDGYTDQACGGADCDDSNPAVHPGAAEVCDGLDNDCDGSVDDKDQDGDGYIDEACGGADCDDTRPDVHPGAVEVCNDTEDNDCDGLTDSDDPDCVGFDSDGDGTPDFRDNCPDDYNPSQTDSDGDGIGNCCDGDCPNLDGQNPVNFADFSILGQHWRSAGANLPGDLNTDGITDINDLSILGTYWLSHCWEE